MRGDPAFSNGVNPEVIGASKLPMGAIRMLRLPEVCRITGLKRAMIYRLQQQKSFPQSVKITDHAVGWIDAEVQTWLARRITAQREGTRHKNDDR